MAETSKPINGRRELIMDGFLAGFGALILAGGAMILYRLFLAWF